MSRHPPIAATIDVYRRKRQKRTPFILGGLAILLVMIGAIILIIGFSNGGGFQAFHLFSTQTPTPTITPSPTNTPIPTDTPTITSTPTETPTSTPSAPYVYVVQEGDYLGKIIQDHGLVANDLLLIFQLNPYRGAGLENSIDPIAQIVYVGQKITLPPPGMQMLTATPIPTNALPGFKITYVVLPGDSLGSIAGKWNSTVEAIVAANKDLLPEGEATVIYPGWTLVVPINLVTPQPTSTTAPIATATPTMTSTP